MVRPVGGSQTGSTDIETLEGYFTEYGALEVGHVERVVQHVGVFLGASV